MNISKISLKETKIKEIPQDWKVVRLEYIATKIDAGQTAPQGKEYFENGKFPFIRVKHLNYLSKGKYVVDSDLINEKAISEYKLRVFPKGSIIFPKSGESIRLERRAILQEDSYVANHFCVIIPNREKINDLFLFYYLAGIRISGLINQTTTPSINLSQIKKIRVSVPSFLEQQKIASVLLTVDEDIQITNEVIKKTKTLKQGLMQRLLTRGIGHTRFVKTDVGEIPEEWEVVKLEDCIKDGPQNGLYRHESLYGSGIHIVRIDDFYDGRFIRTSGFNRVKLQDNEISNYQLKPLDILVNRVNSLPYLGKAAIVPQLAEPAVFESNMMRFATKPKMLLPKFAIKWLCTSYTKRHFQRRAKRAVAQASINQKDVCSLRIPKPPISEQKDVVDILFSVDKKIANEETRKTQLERLKNGLMQHLLTGSVRFKVD